MLGLLYSTLAGAVLLCPNLFISRPVVCSFYCSFFQAEKSQKRTAMVACIMCLMVACLILFVLLILKKLLYLI